MLRNSLKETSFSGSAKKQYAAPLATTTYLRQEEFLKKLMKHTNDIGIFNLSADFTSETSCSLFIVY
jgi:hypothetical protein